MRRLPPWSIACLAFFAAVLQFNVDDALAERAPWITSRIHGSPEKPEPYQVEPAFPKLRFSFPTSVEEVPATDRLLVTERDGKVFSFPCVGDVAIADVALDLATLLPDDLKQKKVSLWDAEFDPQFAANRALYLCYVHPGEGGHTRVSRFTVEKATEKAAAQNAPLRIDPASELVIITWLSGGHNGGCLEFGVDGMLYISTGDGSGPNPPDGLTVGQTVDDLLGAILRVDVRAATKEKPYAVPSDNPFVTEPVGAKPEIWAYGLRNPWKFGIDPKSGDIFAADNGWESWEIVHEIVRGGNCGWPIMEGRAALRSEVKPGPTPIRPPVKDHPHTEANSVIGGPVYRGSQLPDLAGSFVYGDYITGTIWSVRKESDGTTAHRTLVDTDLRIVAFTAATNGDLYVLDYDLTGQIYRLEPSGLPDTSATFPRKLSQTGLFTSLNPLMPAPGIATYDVVAPRWLDGAQARRYIAIPGIGKIRLAESLEDTAEYPEGTVLVKHIVLEAAGNAAVPLETQILHYERGRWHPYSYLWDQSGKEAMLVPSEGSNRTIRVRSPLSPKTGPETKEEYDGKLVDQTWYVNAVNECKLCHNAGPKFVLGFVRNQLDFMPLSYTSSNRLPQLAYLAVSQVIVSTKPLEKGASSILVDPHDESQPLDARARSYLHANCAHCHHPGGNAIASFHLRRELPFDKLNTDKGSGIGTFGLTDPKIITPGEPYRSLLLYRMSKLGYARMPYIGSRVVDSRGVSLVADWIRSMAPDTEPTKNARLVLDIISKESATDGRASRAIELLLESTDGALHLSTAMHHAPFSKTWKIPPATFTAAVKAGVASRSDVRGLFENFIPEAERRKTLGPNVDPAAILALRGDYERGKLIFFSDGARCRNCHELDDPAKSFGPTLAEVNKKHPKLGDLLQHALQPSLKIDEPYAAYTVTTADGLTLTGLLVEQTPQEVFVRTPEKKVVRLARKDVEELQKGDKSLMPERILSDLTAQEAADLFEYVRRQTKK